MAPLIWKHLATSLTRQVAQLSQLNLTLSSMCLRTITTAPRTLLLPSARISSVLPPSRGPSAHCAPSLLGQCQHLACSQPSAGMKTKTALKRRCKDCFFVRRRGHMFVFCKTNPRHKQRQG
ncbi:large ribosomal subunit protein bL36m [Pempheris klunzingeri]|uniref:large ribosomal subunit protein bL36m n=1 Tax=Pempheris klunzingeri TaxID=3127111 RepID=UPI00397F5F8B